MHISYNGWNRREAEENDRITEKNIQKKHSAGGASG